MRFRRPVLGELEAAVLKHIWSRGPCDVRAAYRAIGVRRGITSNTVQSAMERLFRKRLLTREKVGHAYLYAARVSREEWTARTARDAVSGLVGEDPNAMLAAFVHLAERAGDETLDRLERIVAERRAAGRGKQR